ncbi:hypothetical protein D3C72_1617920 [compost metagenome]
MSEPNCVVPARLTFIDMGAAPSAAGEVSENEAGLVDTSLPALSNDSVTVLPAAVGGVAVVLSTPSRLPAASVTFRTQSVPPATAGRGGVAVASLLVLLKYATTWRALPSESYTVMLVL